MGWAESPHPRFAALAAGMAGILLALSLASCGYLRLQRPMVKAGSVNVVALDFQKADLAVEVQVSNPNESTLVIDGYSYDLQIEANPFLQGTSGTEFELKPRDVTSVRVPVSVKFSDLLDKLSALKGKPDAGYLLNLSLAVKTPVGRIPLSFQKEGRVPVLSIPQIRLKEVTIGPMSPRGVVLEALVEITDPGPTVTLTGFNYALSLNGTQLATGSDEKPQPSANGGSRLIRIPIPLDLVKARAVLGSLLVGRDRPMFTISGKASFSSPFGPLTIPFTHTDRIAPRR